ncbi:tubulin epsilon and delta complex protein 2 isoform X2 [Rhinatrema bivittatum]|uniref:tubulin epsilon and delta complex protein 2 isoform X2 n=1 Tax=Rhinatrema bivittatum TaxID=194408 RepID=UPI00112C6B54|nr:tubulin epsilon and delta complex protein 2 isoform X2 [Rhinatrema bivittatum]
MEGRSCIIGFPVCSRCYQSCCPPPYSDFKMLPTDCAGRLLGMLSQAHEDCAEQRKQLEEHLNISRALAGDWKVKLPENPKQDASSENEHGDEPSPVECQELELLNKALAKALRIRERAQGDAEGVEKAVSRKQVPSNSAVHQRAMSKEGTSKTITPTLTQKTSEPTKKPSHYLLKAPYRTDPERKRTRGMATTRPIPTASKSAGRSAAKASVPHKARGSASADKLHRDQSHSIAEMVSPRKESKDSKQLSGGPETDRGLPGEPVVPESQATQTNFKESAASMPPPPHTFTLKEQGVTLRLPLSYRTAYAKNARLWEKSYLCQKNGAECAPAMQFIQRIQATFDSVLPTVSPAKLEEEVTCLNNTYTLMSQHLEAERFVENADFLTWEEEYNSLQTLEGLQTVESQCLCKLQELREAAETYMKMDNGDCTRSNTLADCAVFSEQSCQAVGPMTSPLLFYSSVQELKDMAARKLQVQVLHQRLHIQKWSIRSFTRQALEMLRLCHNDGASMEGDVT